MANTSNKGFTKTKTYKCWQGMKYRCYNPNHKYFAKYSVLPGRVFEGWINDLKAFSDHIGDIPADETVRWSVGRIDNTLGYVPGNIRWEDGFQQNRNRGKTIANTSGATGVVWREGELYREGGRAVCTWYALDGKQKSKSFKAKSVGKDEALRLAEEHRRKMIAELRLLGADYGDTHGD